MSKKSAPTKIAISIGEPAGIGADEFILTIKNSKLINNCIPIVYCDPDLLEQRAKLLRKDINLIHISRDNIEEISTNNNDAKHIFVINKSYKKDKTSFIYSPGKPVQQTAVNTLNYLKLAALDCLNNKCQALVTGPIQKDIINNVAPDFYGHTEYLEDLCNRALQPQNKYKSVMVLMNELLKVALVTTHIPLRNVAESIDIKKITHIAEIINVDLKNKFNIAAPNIFITGLNPHAGENGKLGHEELEVIMPAIEDLQSKNIKATGPYSADSIFSKNFTQNDIILAMYHDQGLAGFKATSFNKSANITLGLPIIRTSVDHGTALDLAGTGNINVASFEYALKNAIEIANNTALNSKDSTTDNIFQNNDYAQA